VEQAIQGDRIPAWEFGDSIRDAMGAIATPAFTQKSTISAIYLP
jgi:hypothetical protein